MKFETGIRDIIPRTHNVKSFRFDRPSSLNYRPGQFMFVAIRQDQKEMTKHFTVSSSPTERGYIEFTKKLTGHEFSNVLDSLGIGDWARIDAPYGRFTFEGEYPKVAMLTGGIGITPMRSMCRYCTDLQLDTDIVLICGNRTERDIVFREDFEHMQNLNAHLRVVLTLEEPPQDWAGLSGRIGADTIIREVPDYEERVFYICGPPAMVEAMNNLLANLGLPRERIKREDFAGY